jgi:hypothetical protein
MALKGKAPGGSRTSRYVRTDYVSSAVSVCHYTLPPHAASRMKAGIVTLLAWLFVLHPSTAMALGKLVTRIWPNFQRA